MLICLLGLCCIILCVNKLLVSLFLGFRQSIGFNPWDENFKLKCFSAINFAMDAGKRICKWEMEIQTYFFIIIIIFFFFSESETFIGCCWRYWKWSCRTSYDRLCLYQAGLIRVFLLSLLMVDDFNFWVNSNLLDRLDFMCYDICLIILFLFW